MKKITALLALLVLVTVVLTGCTLPARGTPPPATNTPAISEAVPTAETGGVAAPTDSGVQPAATSLPAVTETALPEVYPAPPTEAAAAPTLPAPAATLPESTAPTPTAVPPVVNALHDPTALYGAPDFSDPMTGNHIADWEDEDGELPNTEYIRLSLNDSRFYVTGKLAGFSTWYFTWRDLSDFYLQATMESGSCAGQDAYGLIVRGPEHMAGVSYGYVVAFTCDGKLWVFRLDGADPFTTSELVSLTPSPYINAGANQRNLMGIEAVNNTLTIYANGYQVAQVTDTRYEFGRFGVFVSPQWTPFYTYRVVDLAYWDLSD